MEDRIKWIRRQLRLTQSEFAKRIGVKQNTVTTYETGLRTPSESVLLAICREFDVNEKWLRTGEGEPFKQLARKEAIARFAGELMKDEEDSFRIKLVELLAELDESEWAMLERFVDKLTKKAGQD